MAVIAVWKCDRDGTMFADNISYLIEQNIPDVDETVCENIGLLLAKNRDNLAKACKGKPEVLLESETETKDNISPLAVGQ
jgi:dsDNA-binding SOS-regulon protein